MRVTWDTKSLCDKLSVSCARAALTSVTAARWMAQWRKSELCRAQDRTLACPVRGEWEGGSWLPSSPPRRVCMTNLWAYWEKKLAGEAVEASPDDPQCGFYRWARRAAYGERRWFEPVAYWPDNGVIRCRISERDLTPEEGKGYWQSGANSPVTEEAYRAVAEEGKPWPDEHELVPMQGHNRPPEDTSHEGLSAAIEDLAAEAQRRLGAGPIETQDEADRIANLA